MYTRPIITQLPVAPFAPSPKQETRQKYKPNHQQTGLPPHSALPIRGEKNKTKQKTKQKYKSLADRITTLPRITSLAHQRKIKQTNKQKLSTNLTLYETYTNHWTNLRRAETKRKKEFNLEAYLHLVKQTKITTAVEIN